MKKYRPKLLITTHVEKFSDCYIEMQELNKEHYKEVSAHKKHGFDLKPDYTRYFIEENKGSLIYITLRCQGELVGYYIGFLQSDLHYLDCTLCFQDIFFISLKARGQNAFPLLLNAVECEAKRRGANRITFGAKYNKQSHIVKPLTDAGYTPFEIHLIKWLD